MAVGGGKPFPERHALHARAKARIAEKLVELVPDAGCVAIDASSTLTRLATAVDGARDLIVVTNGVQSFDALQDRAGVDAVLTGGAREPRTGSLVGPVACRSAMQFRYDRFFASAAAVDPVVGAAEASLDEAEVKRVMAAHAAEVVVAVDSSKLGGRAPALGISWEDVDVLVTELHPRDARLKQYRRLAKVR